MQVLRTARSTTAVRLAVFAGLFMVCLLSLTCGAMGQGSSASVTGLVKDSTGANVSGVKVTLQSVETNTMRGTVSNGSGNYTFLNVPPGHYTLEFSAPHFQTEKVSAFQLTVNQTLTYEAALRVGEVQSMVTVEAQGTAVESSTAELGMVIGQKPVNDLPLKGRNFTQLLTLTPGVTPISVGQNNSGSNTAVVQDSAYTFPSVNGQGNRENYFLTDGMNNQQAWYNTYAVAPIVDSIQEFKVNSHNDAQFGQVTGGVINVATKTGTNSFHGTAWEYLRNTTFDAKQYFQTAVTPYHQNQFGGTLGGPVRIPKLYNGRDKTFFFVAAEGFHYSKGSTANPFNVPTAAELTGDYDDLYQKLEAIKKGTGTIYDPHTGLPTPTINGKHNQIQSLLDPGAVAFAKAILPAPRVVAGQPAYNAQTVGTTYQKQWNYSGRIDHTFGTRDFVFFRYAGQQLNTTTPNQLPSLISDAEIPSQQYGVSWVHMFSPTTSLQVQFARSHVEQNTTTKFTVPNVIGLYGVDGSLASFLGGVNLMPNLNVSGYWSGGETSNPGKDLSNVHEYLATFSKTLGRQQLQAGGSWDQINYGQTLRNGTVNFGTKQTSGALGVGDGSASFLMGFPSGATKRNIVITERPGGIMSFYAQDSWKLTQRVTVNYGLRYDRTFIPGYGQEGTEGQLGGIETGDFDFTNGTYILQKVPGLCSDRKAAPCLPGTGALPAHVVVSPNTKILHDTTTNFGPRLGVAYRVNDTMAVRASFGIFYDNWAASIQLPQNYQGSWPDTATLDVGSVNVSPANYTSPHNPFGSTAAVLPAATPFTGNINYYVSPWTKNPYSEQYSLGIEQQFGSNVIFSLNYVGSETHRLDIGGYYNTGMPSPYPMGDARRANQVGLNGPQANGQLYGYTPPNRWDRSGANATYNALQAALARRFTNGLAYVVSYTWSKTIDEGQSGYFGVEGNSLQDPYNVRGSRSVSAYNIPQILAINFNYELPVGRNKPFSTHNNVADYVLGNWQINSIYMMRSGQNFTLAATGDIANTGNANTYVRPLVIGNPGLSKRTVNQWFNTAAFATPPSGNIGNGGRNNLQDQTYHNIDFSIFRKFPIVEKFYAEFRAEVFNLTNHTVFGTPATTVNNPTTFGTISTLQSGNNPRTLQFAVKLVF